MYSIKDAILDYMDTRDNEELVVILDNNRDILKNINKPMFRGFTALKNGINLGDIIEQIDYITSWSHSIEVAEYFAIYNLDLLAYDDVVLRNLGVTKDEIESKMVPIIICCRNSFSCLDFSDYVKEEDLIENNITFREEEIITFKDTEFIIKNFYDYKIKGRDGYFVEVEQYSI